MISARVINEDDVLYLVRNLERFEQDKAIKSGLAAGAQRMKRGGIQRLRARMKQRKGVTGALLKSFTVRVKKRRPGALAGFRAEGCRHYAWVDKGTKLRAWKNGRRTTGIMPSLRYWTDTRELDAPAAMQAIYQGVERAVERIKNRRK